MDLIVRLVAVMHGGTAALSLFVAALGLWGASRSGELDAGLAGVALLVVGLSAVFAALSWGTWTYRSWARRPTIAIACVALLTGGGALPAIIMLYTMLNPEVKARFHPAPADPDDEWGGDPED